MRPKKKAELREYLDKENNPNLKNPQIKKNIMDIIHKIQQKPKIEPASTKGLDLLMAARRKTLEDRERKEQDRMLEDKMRIEKQNRLKERVVNSKALVDNTKALDESKKTKQNDFRSNLNSDNDKYKTYLASMYQKVYNKPLMFESMGKKSDKILLGKKYEDKIREAQLDQSNVSQNKDVVITENQQQQQSQLNEEK